MRGLTFGHVAEANARKYPDEPCLVSLTGDGTELTFAEFDERVDRVAHLLRDRGIEAGDAVAVYMRNNVETLETYLGAMKLGALPCPVNHRFKTDEVRYVLADSGSLLCVFDDFARETVATIADHPDTDVRDYLHVGDEEPAFADDFRAERAAASTAPVEVVPDRLDDAALMYTSGTTGKPKGCVLTHDNVVQNTENSVYASGFEECEDRFLVVTPLFHVAAFALFNNTFYTGSTTYLMDEFDPTAALTAIDEHAITGTFMVPTMVRALLAVDDFDTYDVGAMEHFMIGAAPSGVELKRTIVETFDCDLYDAFGQTEMSPVTTLLLPDDVLEKPDSVGKPVINVTMKVVDDDGEEVERGEVGRAAYRGPTAFREYLGMPEKTADVFDDEGFFVSSDLVRRDEEGFVYFVGRYDDMIISGGENIHPAEIEEVLHEHPDVAEVAVVGVPDEEWGERVKAVVVTREGTTLTAEAVSDYVGERLAGFKKPRAVEFLDELPRNPTGKVIKGELR